MACSNFTRVRSDLHWSRFFFLKLAYNQISRIQIRRQRRWNVNALRHADNYCVAKQHAFWHLRYECISDVTNSDYRGRTRNIRNWFKRAVNLNNQPLIHKMNNIGIQCSKIKLFRGVTENGAPVEKFDTNCSFHGPIFEPNCFLRSHWNICIRS